METMILEIYLLVSCFWIFFVFAELWEKDELQRRETHHPYFNPPTYVYEDPSKLLMVFVLCLPGFNLLILGYWIWCKIASFKRKTNVPDATDF